MSNTTTDYLPAFQLEKRKSITKTWIHRCPKTGEIVGEYYGWLCRLNGMGVVVQQEKGYEVQLPYSSLTENDLWRLQATGQLGEGPMGWPLRMMLWRAVTVTVKSQ
ncbi:hypothetical protein LTR37_013801 [Vermiconidia calcicola]|uniref:Uncharacterized protein n=1 Tax=Vermiconidia calcicola TaxID=1690605 RepID=A0ACC3MVF9_9PEZI|nr:hypothetical protein LTR37_013801 [Vermiconidia calcicola]